MSRLGQLRHSDITATIKAVERSGNTVARVTISPEGAIIVELAPPVANEPVPESERNPWDEALK